MSCSLEIQLIMFFLRGGGFVKLWKFQTMLLPIFANLPRIFLTFQKKGEKGGSNTALDYLYDCFKSMVVFREFLTRVVPLKLGMYLICNCVFIQFHIMNFYKWEAPILNLVWTEQCTRYTPQGNPIVETFFSKAVSTPIPHILPNVCLLVIPWE